MKSKFKIENVAAPVLFVVGVVLTIVAFGPFRLSNDTAAVAERVSATVERRIVRLEAFMAQAMREDHSRWLELDGLPEDMVIYRYCGDTLQSWRNEFPVYNDNLGLPDGNRSGLVRRLSGLRSFRFDIAGDNRTFYNEVVRHC